MTRDEFIERWEDGWGLLVTGRSDDQIIIMIADRLVSKGLTYEEAEETLQWVYSVGMMRGE